MIIWGVIFEDGFAEIGISEDAQLPYLACVVADKKIDCVFVSDKSEENECKKELSAIIDKTSMVNFHGRLYRNVHAGKVKIAASGAAVHFSFGEQITKSGKSYALVIDSGQKYDLGIAEKIYLAVSRSGEIKKGVLQNRLRKYDINNTLDHMVNAGVLSESVKIHPKNLSECRSYFIST